MPELPKDLTDPFPDLLTKAADFATEVLLPAMTKEEQAAFDEQTGVLSIIFYVAVVASMHKYGIVTNETIIAAAKAATQEVSEQFEKIDTSSLQVMQ